MKIKNTVLNDPQLSYRKTFTYHQEGVRPKPTDREHYALSLEYPHCGEDHLYALIIRYYWNGESWNHYSFGKFVMGDFHELVSAEEFDRRLQHFTDNEGEENVDKWYAMNADLSIIRGIEIDIKDALIKRWEALCELVNPHVTG